MFSNTGRVNITAVLLVQYSILTADWWSQKLWIFFVLVFLFWFVFCSPRWVRGTGNTSSWFSILFCTSGSRTWFFFLLTEGLQTQNLFKGGGPTFMPRANLGTAMTVFFWLESCMRGCSGTYPSSPKHTGCPHHPMQHEWGTQGMQFTGCYRGAHIIWNPHGKRHLPDEKSEKSASLPNCTFPLQWWAGQEGEGGHPGAFSPPARLLGWALPGEAAGTAFYYA